MSRLSSMSATWCKVPVILSPLSWESASLWIFFLMRLCVLLSQPTPSSRVPCPLSSCQCPFLGHSPHVCRFRCPHPISQGPVPSQSGANITESQPPATRPGLPLAGGECLLVGHPRSAGPPMPLSLRCQVPRVLQPSAACLPPLWHLVTTCKTVSRCITVSCQGLAVPHLPPILGSPLLAGHQVIQH